MWSRFKKKIRRLLQSLEPTQNLSDRRDIRSEEGKHEEQIRQIVRNDERIVQAWRIAAARNERDRQKAKMAKTEF